MVPCRREFYFIYSIPRVLQWDHINNWRDKKKQQMMRAVRHFCSSSGWLRISFVTLLTLCVIMNANTFLIRLHEHECFWSRKKWGTTVSHYVSGISILFLQTIHVHKVFVYLVTSWGSSTNGIVRREGSFVGKTKMDPVSRSKILFILATSWTHNIGWGYFKEWIITWLLGR